MHSQLTTSTAREIVNLHVKMLCFLKKKNMFYYVSKGELRVSFIPRLWPRPQPCARTTYFRLLSRKTSTTY